MKLIINTSFFMCFTALLAYAPIVSARTGQAAGPAVEESNDERDDDLIEQRYVELYNNIVEGKFSVLEVARSLRAVLAAVMELDYASLEQKKRVIGYLLRTVDKLLQKPKPGQKVTDYFHGKTEANFRKSFLRELQKVLERSDDLIETKMLVRGALTGETE
ncbi:MAG TPA: hypothetical protein VEL47_01790 [Myxococcota bacterium]|nr:hypothetical protein [Myxococcota bacterium]